MDVGRVKRKGREEEGAEGGEGRQQNGVVVATAAAVGLVDMVSLLDVPLNKVA